MVPLNSSDQTSDDPFRADEQYEALRKILEANIKEAEAWIKSNLIQNDPKLSVLFEIE